MIYLDCSGVHFGSQLDEKHLFDWAIQIPGVLRWEQDTLVVRTNFSHAALRDLLALFSRYQIPMAQLAQFRTVKNEKMVCRATNVLACSRVGQGCPLIALLREVRDGLLKRTFAAPI